eukprot:2202234-Rhodomonas_salina.1
MIPLMSTARLQRGHVVSVHFLLLLCLVTSVLVPAEGETWTEEDDELQFAAEESCQEWLTIYGDCIEQYVGQVVVDLSLIHISEPTRPRLI